MPADVDGNPSAWVEEKQSTRQTFNRTLNNVFFVIGTQHDFVATLTRHFSATLFWMDADYSESVAGRESGSIASGPTKPISHTRGWLGRGARAA